MRRFPINFAIHFLHEQETRTRTNSTSQSYTVRESREEALRVVPRGSYPRHESALDQLTDHGQAFGLHLVQRSIGLGGEVLDSAGSRSGSVARHEELGYERLYSHVEREPGGEAQIESFGPPLCIRRPANLFQADVIRQPRTKAEQLLIRVVFPKQVVRSKG